MDIAGARRKRTGIPGVHTQLELQALMFKAIGYLQGRNAYFSICNWFYRDKSVEYFDDILRSNGCSMQPYLKDHHGDPKSPINGRLNGLFFNVNIDTKTGQVPHASLFGEQRLLIPACCMGRDCPNIYFADFYCIKMKAHYVTLVMTTPGSASDIFCQNHLILLNPFHNPFFQVFGFPLNIAYVTTGVWVEILYTRGIHIPTVCREGAWFTRVPMTGNRSGGKVGLPKHPECHICNL